MIGEFMMEVNSPPNSEEMWWGEKETFERTAGKLRFSKSLPFLVQSFHAWLYAVSLRSSSGSHNRDDKYPGIVEAKGRTIDRKVENWCALDQAGEIADQLNSIAIYCEITLAKKPQMSPLIPIAEMPLFPWAHHPQSKTFIWYRRQRLTFWFHRRHQKLRLLSIVLLLIVWLE